MKGEQFNKILDWIKDQFEVKDEDLDAELERWYTFDREVLISEVEKEFSVDRKEFERELYEYLVLKAKPWIKREQIK